MHKLKSPLMFLEGAEGGAAGAAAGAGTDGTEAKGGAGDPQPTDDDDKLGEGGKKALVAERARAAAAEATAKDLQAKIDAIEAEKLSDLEKAQKAAEDANAAAAKATTEALRYRIAAAHGISTAPGKDGEPSDAELFLTGTDEAAMTAQAARLSARVSDSRTSGTFVAREGTNPTTEDDDRRAFLRRLTGQN